MSRRGSGFQNKHMGGYFTQRVSLPKGHINPRSSRLCVRKGGQKPSKGTEAGSVRDEKVSVPGRENTFDSASGGTVPAGQGWGASYPGMGGRAYTGMYTLPWYPGGYTLPYNSEV